MYIAKVRNIRKLTIERLKLSGLSGRFVVRLPLMALNIQIWDRWRRLRNIFYFKFTGIYQVEVSLKVTIVNWYYVVHIP